jgi:oligopeptide transport system substrate-binding protein
VVRNSYYWDAENVSLDGIRFYPAEDFSTMMNLYKSGIIDAVYNHSVPSGWTDYVRGFKDEYLLHPEMSIMYYSMSVRKPPMDKLEVRKAFSLAIDRNALSKYLKTTSPLTEFMPEGIFPDYEKARKRVFARERAKNGISDEEWTKKVFDPRAACLQMEKAGFSIESRDDGKCVVTDFPADDVILTYNTLDLHKQVAEFVQAQWKQNLGIEIQLENLEWRTYLEYGNNVEYKGVIRAGWVGDYVDPFAFLLVWYKEHNHSFSGWWNPDYDRLLEQANSELEPQKRYELLAEAEFMMLAEQPVIPLATNQTNWVKKPYVKGMYPNPGTMHPWKFVYIESDRAKWDRDVENIMSGPLDPRVADQVDDLVRSGNAGR